MIWIYLSVPYCAGFNIDSGGSLENLFAYKPHKNSEFFLGCVLLSVHSSLPLAQILLYLFILKSRWAIERHSFVVQNSSSYVSWSIQPSRTKPAIKTQLANLNFMRTNSYSVDG